MRRVAYCRLLLLRTAALGQNDETTAPDSNDLVSDEDWVWF